MNEKLFRPQFDRLKLSDKLRLMQTLAARYHLTFKDLYAFSRWGQSCTTGIFEKAGREFVFVPGGTITLGWEGFVQGMDKANLEELADLFAEIEYEGTAENFLRQGMTPVRQVTIGPMLVGRKLEKIGWERVPMNDPRITAHPDWLDALQKLAGRDGQSFEIHETVRFERNGDNWQAWLCHRMTYPKFLLSLVWELAATPPHRTSGPIWPGADAAPCSPGGMDWTTPCICTTLKARKSRAGHTTWSSPTSSACPSPTIPTSGSWWTGKH